MTSPVLWASCILRAYLADSLNLQSPPHFLVVEGPGRDGGAEPAKLNLAKSS